MVQTMPAEERDGDDLAGLRARVVQDCDGRGRGAPGGGDVEDGGLGEAWELAETGTTNYTDVYWVWKVAVLVMIDIRMKLYQLVTGDENIQGGV